MATRWRPAADEDLTELSEINVTPFIDVMLVLLIIFMVAAPLATVDVPVDLPAASAKPEPPPDKPVYVTLKADLALAVDDELVSVDELPAALDRLSGHELERRVFVRADRLAPYGELMKVVNVLRRAGYLKVGLVALDDSAGGTR